VETASSARPSIRRAAQSRLPRKVQLSELDDAGVDLEQAENSLPVDAARRVYGPNVTVLRDFVAPPAAALTPLVDARLFHGAPTITHGNSPFSTLIPLLNLCNIYFAFCTLLRLVRAGVRLFFGELTKNGV